MRISIEWSRLYPTRGQLDQSAVDTYNKMFDCMEKCAPDFCSTHECSLRLVLRVWSCLCTR